MSFAKLDSGIVNSTLWVQPDDVLRVWIWFLSQADAYGVVRTAAPALALICMKSVDRVREILAILEAPDPDSRSEVEEGRRIRKVPGGWQIVNYRAYRERVAADEKRENDRIRIAEKRAAARADAQSVAPRREVSQPVANVAQAEAEVEAVDQNQEQARSRGSRLPQNWQLPDDWRTWAQGERPDLDVPRVAAQFADHWRAKPGKDGRKADWQATWRNWVRNERGTGPPRNAQPQPSRRMSAIQTLMQGTSDGQHALAERRDPARAEPLGLPLPGRVASR